MKLFETQESFIIKTLLKNKKISRNYCLSHRITRLGAYICDLKKSGWKIEAGYEISRFSKDYVYSLIASPTIKNNAKKRKISN